MVDGISARRQPRPTLNGRFIRGQLALLLGLVGLFVSCSRTPDPEVVATVGSKQIRRGELQALLRLGGGPARRQDPRRLLDEMIEREVLHQRAVSLGLEHDPEVQRAVRNLLIGKLRERELHPKLEAAQVTSEEARAEYEQHLDQHTRPARMRLAILQLKRNATTSPSRVAEWQSRLAVARQQALLLPATEPGFGTLAVSHSEDQATRYKGGDTGWLECGRATPRWNPAVLKAGESLVNPGQVSEVLTESDGVYLVRLIERREPEVIPFEREEAAVRQRLLAQKREAIETAFLESARQRIPVTQYPEALQGLAPQLAASSPASTPPAWP